MELWQLIALLAAGAIGVGALAKSSAAQASAASPQTSGPTQAEILEACFQAALGTERNVNVLQTFANKLTTAGYVSYASSLMSKRTAILQMGMAPMPTTLTIIPALAQEESGS
jgi:hypothetical protein